jgi:hypothetical protein
MIPLAIAAGVLLAVALLPRPARGAPPLLPAAPPPPPVRRQLPALPTAGRDLWLAEAAVARLLKDCGLVTSTDHV